MRTRLFRGCLLISGLLMLAGCSGEPGRQPVFPTEGTIVKLGRPIPGIMVLFHPVKPVATAKGEIELAAITTETDADGKYRLSTYLADDGAPEGDYVVTLKPGQAPSLEDGDGRREPAPAVDPAILKYARRESSPFKATVKPGQNHFDFEVK